MGLSAFIGKRYVTTTWGKGFVSFISIISVLGIAMGIMALIVVLSVMNGVTGDVRDKILSMTAHAKIIGTDDTAGAQKGIRQYIANESSVVAHSPYIEGQAMIGVGQSYNGVQIKGIDPNTESSVSDTLEKVGSDINTLKAGEFNVIIGKSLANQIGAHIGKKITLLVPKTTISAAGILPRLKRFTVSAIFESGHYHYDTGLILVNINDAKKLLQRNNDIDGYQLKLDDLFAAQGLTKRLNEQLPMSMFAIDWTTQNKSYFDAVKVEKAALFLIMMIIVMVAAFNILSALVMVVTDKQKDIAILRTIGATPSTIMRIFIFQGTILGISGTFLGTIVGIVIAKQVPNIMMILDEKYGISLPQELYFISSLNPRIELPVVALITGSSLLLAFLATLYPAYKAANLQPARALSHE